MATVLLLSLTPLAQSRDLYRYYDDEGHMVVDYRVPTAYAARGYEVLNDDGIVVKVVPRELSEDEREVADAQQKIEAEALAEQERLRKWDESLLLRYSTIADIEAARERALSELRIRVSILKSNKRGLRHQVESYQASAADIERSGEEVDLAQLQIIESLQGEIGVTDRAIKDRQQEIEHVASVYQQDIERFEMLLEVVALRKSLMLKEQQARQEDPRR